MIHIFHELSEYFLFVRIMILELELSLCLLLDLCVNKGVYLFSRAAFFNILMAYVTIVGILCNLRSRRGMWKLSQAIRELQDTVKETHPYPGAGG